MSRTMPLSTEPNVNGGDCRIFVERRQECLDRHGLFSEDCLIEKLEEKRCLSFELCPIEAAAFYGHRMIVSADQGIEVLPKATCSLWSEAFSYVHNSDPFVATAHQDAQVKVNKSKVLKEECRYITRLLANCLQVRRKAGSYQG